MPCRIWKNKTLQLEKAGATDSAPLLFCQLNTFLSFLPDSPNVLNTWSFNLYNRKDLFQNPGTAFSKIANIDLSLHSLWNLSSFAHAFRVGNGRNSQTKLDIILVGPLLVLAKFAFLWLVYGLTPLPSVTEGTVKPTNSMIIHSHLQDRPSAKQTFDCKRAVAWGHVVSIQTLGSFPMWQLCFFKESQEIKKQNEVCDHEQTYFFVTVISLCSWISKQSTHRFASMSVISHADLHTQAKHQSFVQTFLLQQSFRNFDQKRSGRNGSSLVLQNVSTRQGSNQGRMQFRECNVVCNVSVTASPKLYKLTKQKQLNLKCSRRKYIKQSKPPPAEIFCRFPQGSWNLG